MDKSICQLLEKHENGIITNVGNALFQLTCPRCGEFVLLTQTDLEDAIITALEKQERFINIERIA